MPDRRRRDLDLLDAAIVALRPDGGLLWLTLELPGGRRAEVKVCRTDIHWNHVNYIRCDVCSNEWDTVSPCALCNATRSYPSYLLV